jgi:peptidyl-prolyl cis-trans isomerase A (cyclophilin A)
MLMTLSFVPRHVLSRAIFTLAISALGASCQPDSGGAGSRGASGAEGSLTKPDKSAIASPAPDSFKVAFETSKGNFTVVAHRDWAPLGVDRFYHLVRLGFYDETRFFRVLSGFMAQFGVNGDPRVNAAWEPLRLEDDPVKQKNLRGMVTFAMGGPNTRTTQLFINYGDNTNLDAMGFAPVAQVTDGMAVVDSLYANYGEGAPDGGGPDQGRIAAEGNAYLQKSFPLLDFIRRARVVP